MVISRDVTFDESKFGFLMEQSSEEVDDTALDLNLLDVNGEEERQKIYKQTGKCKNQGDTSMSPPARNRTGLEEGSKPIYSHDHRSRHHKNDQESKMEADEGEQEESDEATPPTFCRASANAVEVSDMTEPTTFQEAINGPDQVHWRNAVDAELKSMHLRGVFRAAQL